MKNYNSYKSIRFRIDHWGEKGPEKMFLRANCIIKVFLPRQKSHNMCFGGQQGGEGVWPKSKLIKGHKKTLNRFQKRFIVRDFSQWWRCLDGAQLILHLPAPLGFGFCAARKSSGGALINLLHKAPASHTWKILIEINLTAMPPIISVIYYCFSLCSLRSHTEKIFPLISFLLLWF